jgi:ribosomal protein L11 methyltransferase
MRSIDFSEKTVFDFGTGTGILAILAEKLGATAVTAIDNDEWSINNAEENIRRNNCKKTLLQLNSGPPASQKFDIILANINRNVILEHLSALSKMLNKNAQLLVSGLLQEDEQALKSAAYQAGLNYTNTIRYDKWILMKFLA